MVYATQENVASKNYLKITYKNIRKQTDRIFDKLRQSLLLGDINANVGTYIEGNTPIVTKRKRQLKKIVKKFDLVLENIGKGFR